MSPLKILAHTEDIARVTAIPVDELARRTGGDSVRVLRRPGDSVDADMGTSGESVVVLGSDPDYSTLLETLEYARRTVTVVMS